MPAKLAGRNFSCHDTIINLRQRPGPGPMKTYDLSELALRNLRESSLRNSLTTIGISVGVASLVAMLSLGIGLQKLATRHLAKSGLFDTVVVTSRRDLRGFSRDDERNTASAAESRTLDEPARQEIEHLPDVLEAYPDIRFITELSYQDKPHLTMVSGIPDSARARTTLSLESRAASSLLKLRLRSFCKNRLPWSCWARRRHPARKTMSR